MIKVKNSSPIQFFFIRILPSRSLFLSLFNGPCNKLAPPNTEQCLFCFWLDFLRVFHLNMRCIMMDRCKRARFYQKIAIFHTDASFCLSEAPQDESFAKLLNYLNVNSHLFYALKLISKQHTYLWNYLFISWAKRTTRLYILPIPYSSARRLNFNHISLVQHRIKQLI